ncbi:MAG: YggS family pyridoxal phosphate-dependent enzyme [Bacteroidota bacterium]|nr:YggS family pyridoxal phosphate-dependent enzyme [Bacteroidota bacterium]
MGLISDNIQSFLEKIPENVQLIPISKTKPNDMILDAWQNGFKVFGENKVQELVRKFEELPEDIQWHMVGHLQSNKMKYIAPFVHLLHGVDSFKLIKIMDKEAKKAGRILNGLFQLHIASEETKFGFLPDEIFEILDSRAYAEIENVRMIGVMGMATLTNNESIISKEFKELYNTYLNLKSRYFQNDENFKEISMGMSGDYEIAIKEGSSMIRIGSAIFGERYK